MSAKTFINIGIFVAGAAAGSLATYFVVRDHFAKVADDEIEQMRSWAREKVVLKDGERKKEIADAYAEANDDDISSLDSSVLKNLIKTYADNLSTLTGGDIDIIDEVDEYIDENFADISAVNPPEDAPDNVGCEILDVNDFVVDDSYDKVTLTYYAGDNMFIDEDDAPIDDISIFLGNLSGAVKEAKKNVYIRNHNTVCDYEVVYNALPFVSSDT